MAPSVHNNDRAGLDAAVRGLEDVFAGDDQRGVAEPVDRTRVLTGVDELLEEHVAGHQAVVDPQRRGAVGPCEEHAALRHRHDPIGLAERCGGEVGEGPARAVMRPLTG